ncbi:alpha/beta hydrolase [Nostocoides sp. HKS02]|uniref:alpha/beta hydrolase n=1 Tax=Nostocoides sp. HKS02 TaxID=1813880 RepID=UPI0018A879DD|nr:alpha/beta hydrolase [Tetrasphaera sp. HKS02]
MPSWMLPGLRIERSAAMPEAAELPGATEAVVTAPVPPLVVLVPGLGLDDRAWTEVRRQLGHPSVVTRLPSLGKPAQRGTNLGIEHQTRRLLAQLPPGRRLVLVGHSASCPVVVEAAASSDEVVGLVLVGPVTDPRARTWPRILGQWLRTACHERPWEGPVLVPQYRHTGVLAMLRGIDAIRHFATHEAVARLTVPVTVLRGEYDRIAPSDWCRQLAELSGGECVTVAGAAHMVPLTHPQTIVSAIARLPLASPA